MKTEFTTGSRKRTAEVVAGDIAKVTADAMITAINSAGAWMGGIDSVIFRCAGAMFHQQAADKMPLTNLETIVAHKTSQHSGQFGDVVFVVDDVAKREPLRKVIKAALKAASNAGYRHVSIPAIRTGITLGVVEKNAKTAVGEMLCGIGDFFTQNPNTSIEHFTFVIYGQNEVLAEMTHEIPKLLVN